MKIGVIGVGRLGICFALLLDKAGYQVVGSDIREDYVSLLNQKKITTNEPQVADMLAESTNIRFTVGNTEVIELSDVIYVMVATPSLPDGSYDVSAVWNAIQDVKVSKNDLRGKILVIGCTTNPGDCAKIQAELRDLGVKVLYNPEFIAQGAIVHDLQHADMVLIGGEEQGVMDIYARLYNDIQVTQPRINTMSLTAAEITKIAINCFLTTKISYANMVGEVLIKSGLESDVDKVLKAVGEDTRIGSKYMRFGFGYGGPCLPRDNRAFGHYSSSLGIDFNLGNTVDAFNREHAKFMRDYYIAANKDKLPFYMSSITYKPNSDIIHESQQLQLCRDLLDAGYTVLVEDHPMIPKQLKDELLSEYEKVKFINVENVNSVLYRVN